MARAAELLAACLVISAALVESHPGEREPFIGWRGETYDPNVVWDSGAKVPTEKPEGEKERWIELLSWKPRAFLYHNFLSSEEASHLIKLAASKMKRSGVVGNNENGTGNGSVNDIRTSYGTFLKRRQDDIIERLEERLANWTHVPAYHQEEFQILRYDHFQKYGPHMDIIDGDDPPRFATVLLYLKECESGGETAFPYGSEWANPELEEKYGPWSDCAKGHVAAKPKKGDALLFYSMKPDGVERDEIATHTGCPILEGVKWTATKWIHTGPFRYDDYMTPREPNFDPGLCSNKIEECDKWAKEGLCERNPGFMIGEDTSVGGRCRLACKSCEACHNRDAPCYNANREKAGFLILDESEWQT